MIAKRAVVICDGCDASQEYYDAGDDLLPLGWAVCTAMKYERSQPHFCPDCAKKYPTRVLAVYANDCCARSLPGDKVEPEPPSEKPCKKLSKAAKKRHLESGGDGGCPFCGDEDMGNLDYGEPEPEMDGVLKQTATCLACNCQWIDEYKLVNVYGVDPKTGAWE